MEGGGKVFFREVLATTNAQVDSDVCLFLV